MVGHSHAAPDTVGGEGYHSTSKALAALLQSSSLPACPTPEEKPKTNVRVWRVSKAMGLKASFRKGRESQTQTQSCLFSCLHHPMGCMAAAEDVALPSPLAPAHMLFIMKS